MEKLKKLNLMMFFVGLLFCISCQDAELTLGEEDFDCGSSSKIVKKVKNQEGRLHYNTFLKRYAITVTEANTYDSKDVGLICTNTEHLTIPSKEEAISVVFDGRYRESDEISPIAGTTFYELELQKIKFK